MRFVHPCMVTLSTSIAINRTHLGKYIICVFCIWVCIQSYTMCIYIIYMYIYVLYTHDYNRLYVYIYICVYIYIYVYIYMYVYICMCIYIYADDCRCMIYKYITHKISNIHHMDMEGKCKRNGPDQGHVGLREADDGTDPRLVAGRSDFMGDFMGNNDGSSINKGDLNRI